ncbi:SYT1 [Symbiodinium pilosum]|uniref:SYT1 protein n=1 Tax=Symbiodinium pilosum TaxID=2952 RepID=A0A812YKL6_SYMPI|nr:SYT1 [Symbiodinium pilosum]
MSRHQWPALALLVIILPFVVTRGEPVEKPPPDVAAFAAAAALEGLEDVQRLESQITADESQRLATRDVGPLEIYTFIDESLGLLIDTALAAVRHAAAATAGSELNPILLSEASLLEKQLNNMLAAQTKEPLFFWHGPKRYVSSQLQRLFGRGPWHQQLKELANAGSTSLSALVGEASSETKRSPLQGKLPLIGLAVDDSYCPKGGPCSLETEVQALASLSKKESQSDSGLVHVVLLPCPEAALEHLGSLLRPMRAKLYVSAMLPPELFDALSPREASKPASVAQLMEGYISSLIKALGIPIDLIWLPYAAFKKQYWPGTQKMLEKTHSWVYGIRAEVQQASVAQKLLLRKPAPVAWLSTDDLLRPVQQDAIHAALEAGIACVSLPRKEAAGRFAAKYFKAAGLKEEPLVQVAQLHWAWRRGLSAMWRGGELLPGEAQFKTNVLKAAAFSSSHYQAGHEEVPSDAWKITSPLEAALHSGRTILQKAEASPPTGTYKDADSSFSPGVSAATLTGLADQAKTFKANDHIIYAEDFFDDQTFAAIKEETERLWMSEDIEANCNLDGTNRLGGYVLDHVPRNSSLYRLIYGNDPFRQWVSAVNAEGPMWPSDFPIEVREYGRHSRGMGCHPDLQMYKVPRKDLEFAFTVDNDSRCNVSFWDAAGKLHLVQTKPNSIMMVGVNAATHCVSSTDGGTRTILKFIYVGDYRKSNEFWSYTTNECDDSNPNRQMLSDRRTVRQRQARSLEL